MIKCIWSLTVYNLDTHNITQGMQCENDIRSAAVYFDLYAVLSLWTLLLLLKPQTREQTSQNTKVKNYIDSLTNIIVVAPCSFKYKINTVEGQIPGILKLN